MTRGWLADILHTTELTVMSSGSNLYSAVEQINKSESIALDSQIA